MKFYHITLLFFLMACSCQNKTSIAEGDFSELDDPWAYKDSIVENIIVPDFPGNAFNILDYGAVEGGIVFSTNAINSAITACNQNGGGTVTVPEGIWLTGPVVLKSNVNLNIEEGATLLFSTNKDKYLPVVHTRFEGMECMNYSPLIYAYQCENIGITGKGKLDGQGHVWWHWKGKWSGSVDHGYDGKSVENQKEDVATLTQMVADTVPLEERVFGEGHYLRPSFIQPYKCKNVLVEGIKIVKSPMWIVHPVLCENVTVRNISIESLGPNNDGCNPESCNNVLIDSCYFNTGDDCIAIKSGRNNDGRRIGVPGKNIVVRNCTMVEGHGGVVMGSEISGNVSHVFAENCVMNSPNLERAIRIKSNSLRGGTVEHVYVRDIEVKQVREAVLKINLYYADGRGNNIPVVRDIHIENITSHKSEFGYWIKGIDSIPVCGIKFIDCDFNNVEKEFFEENTVNVEYKNFRINGKMMD
ncbi:MAG: glycoside hydrolase family 28 protein [Prolixibacteraceae bacterium]|nr:glycoside hydrolase family 28 protein [Prolixibacteraceae bacterium]